MADALGSTITSPADPSPLPVDPDPITRTQIPANLLSKFADSDLLDLTLGNYRTWSRRVLDVLSVCGDLEDYIAPSAACPDRVTHAASAKAWTQNNHHVFSYIRLQCSDNEREHIGSITSASGLWSFLRDRHVNRGPHAQVLLLCDLLQLRFDVSAALIPQAHQCFTVCRQIISMGPLDVESLGKVALLHMMRDSLPDLQRHIADSLSRATEASPYTVADIIKRVELEQSLRDDGKPRSSGLTTDLALAAQSARGPGSRPPKQCSHCKRNGHVTADCFQPGGPMEHK
ncbi:hypothetical protein C8Q77DRAFT_1062232, partial [Trametes polyzona]